MKFKVINLSLTAHLVVMVKEHALVDSPATGVMGKSSTWKKDLLAHC